MRFVQPLLSEGLPGWGQPGGDISWWFLPALKRPNPTETNVSLPNTMIYAYTVRKVDITYHTSRNSILTSTERLSWKRSTGPSRPSQSGYILYAKGTCWWLSVGRQKPDFANHSRKANLLVISEEKEGKTITAVACTFARYRRLGRIL